jgi:glycosyltransferase involved in cell wall biosynthesis
VSHDNTPVSRPLVTVVTACRDMARYLGATLESVRAQTLEEFEVIMVDDASTDTTLAVMRRFASEDERFKVISLARRQGPAAARNAALAQACGKFVAILDGDDIWTSNALSLRVDFARRFPSADVVATDFAWFEEVPSDRPIGRVGLGPRAKQYFASGFATGEPTLLEDPFELVATTHFAWVGATLVRRYAMAAIGDFDPAFKGQEDTLLWLRLAQRGAFVFVPQITAHYRQRTGSIVHARKGPAELEYLKVLDWVRGRPEFAVHANVIRRLAAECHHVAAQYYRRSGDDAGACRHALSAVRLRLKEWSYWRELAAAGLYALRSTAGNRR